MKKIFITSIFILFSFFKGSELKAEIFEYHKCTYTNNNIWSLDEWKKRNARNEVIYDFTIGTGKPSNKYYQELEDRSITIDTDRSKIIITEIRTEKSISENNKEAKYFRDTQEGNMFLEKSILGENIELTKNIASYLGMTLEEFVADRKKETIEGLLYTKKYKIEEFNLVSYSGGLVIGEQVYNNGNKYLIYFEIDKAKYRTASLSTLEKEVQHSSIYCENNANNQTNDDENNILSSGTAFFIDLNGHLLTNNHVVEGCSLSKISYKNYNYDAKLVATDKNLDLALLKTEAEPKSFFSFAKDDAKKLNKVYVAGYPLGKGLSDDLKISSGIVSSLKGFDDNSNEIQIDAPINPGNSGGPIINENGSLVAIAVSGLAKDQTEGINFGIKSSAAETFLKANNINPKKSMYSGIKENDQLLEILEEGTVYTYCK